MCLAYCEQSRLPTSEAARDELFEAGLGEKEIIFSDVNCSAEQFQNTLFRSFPQLRDGGGYQLLKCLPNTRDLEPLSALVLSSPSLLKQRVGTARTYIRPLQRDLDLTPTRSVLTQVTFIWLM